MKRWALRAVSSSIPIAMSTWEGRVTPALQAEPVELLMPCISSRKSRVSPSAFSKVKWALPGQSLLAGVFFGERVFAAQVR